MYSRTSKRNRSSNERAHQCHDRWKNLTVLWWGRIMNMFKMERWPVFWASHTSFQGQNLSHELDLYQ